MKKILFTLIAMTALVVQANAMSYEQARREALFLTDKMAYELNLTDAQYEAAYEINLDYLMGVTGRHDVFGSYWERRNADLNYILYNWQWELFRAATYFFRPLYWDAGYWHFRVYTRYPYRDYYYFGRPHFYASYRGGHSWHHNGGRSYYAHHHNHYRPQVNRDHHRGMRDGWNRGDNRSHSHGTHTQGQPGGNNNGTHTQGQPGGNHGYNGNNGHQGGSDMRGNNTSTRRTVHFGTANHNGMSGNAGTRATNPNTVTSRSLSSQSATRNTTPMTTTSSRSFSPARTAGGSFHSSTSSSSRSVTSAHSGNRSYTPSGNRSFTPSGNRSYTPANTGGSTFRPAGHSARSGSSPHSSSGGGRSGGRR